MWRRWLQTAFYFEPDGVGGGAGGTNQGAASQQAPVTSGSPSGSAGGSSTPASAAPSSPTPAQQVGSGQGAATSPAAPAQPTPAEQWVSVRDLARNLGVTDAGNFQDDESFVRHLIAQRQAAQQLSQLQPWVQQFQQHGPQFQQWLRSQQAQQQAQQQQNQPWYHQWWNPPEYNRAWDRQIIRDANGNLSLAPGADPTILAKYHAYQQFRSQAADRLMENPYSFFEEPIKHLAAQVAQQAIQQHLGQYQSQVTASQLTDPSVNPWLYQQDQATGQLVRDPQSGQLLLSREGMQFATYCREAEQLGIQDVQAKYKYALKNVQLDYAKTQLQGQQQANGAQQAQQQANQQFLQQAAQQRQQPAIGIPAGGAHQPNQGPNQSPNGNQNGAQPGQSLNERMTRNLLAAGFQLGQPVTTN